MVTPNTSPYKPSPLSFGSPRASPFRRPSVASSPTPVVRPNQPASPSSKPATPTQSPSKLSRHHTADDDVFSNSNGLPTTPNFRDLQSPSPVRGSPYRGTTESPSMSNRTHEKQSLNSEAVARLPPAQLREMREAFQVLDRDNDGQVNREDVADILNNLGQDNSSSATSSYFPPGAPQNINLPTYLNKIASLLAQLSDPQELLNAFAAFDEDDSGQVDLKELRDALLHTNPDPSEKRLTEEEVDEVVSGFTSRRAFGAKGAKSSGYNNARNRSEVFRYQDFVTNIAGNANQSGDKAS